MGDTKRYKANHSARTLCCESPERNFTIRICEMKNPERKPDEPQPKKSTQGKMAE
jgi:hypothetical protein